MPAALPLAPAGDCQRRSCRQGRTRTGCCSCSGEKKRRHGLRGVGCPGGRRALPPFLSLQAAEGRPETGSAPPRADVAEEG